MKEFSKDDMNMIRSYMAMKHKEFIATYKAIMEQGGFVNDHNGEWEPHEDFVVFWKGSTKEICPIYPSSACCLNPIYVGEDGKPHLSRWSVGGNVVGDDIKRYNEMHSPFNNVHRNWGIECLQKFSTRDTEDNVPW